MITYSNTKPWITVHFNLYKHNRCTPAAEQTNYHFSSKQISQKMHTRDNFSIMHYFIISQFSTVWPQQSPPGLLRFYIYPLNTIHLHVYLCILLLAVISQPSYSFDKANYAFHDQILSFLCSSAVKTGYIQNRCKRSCLRYDGCYNTTTDHL